MLLTLAVPGVAVAAVDVVGSDLSGSAATAIQRTEDTALSQLTSPGGARPVVLTNSGQIVAVRVKGCSRKANVGQDPETVVFVQDLRTDDAGVTLVVSSSQPFNLPICGRGADADTVSTFVPTDQCVTRGDHFGLVVGGQTPGYPQGTEYLLLKAQPGRGARCVLGSNQAVNGSRFRFAPVADIELLAQASNWTGPDSPSGCAGDPGGPVPPPGGGAGGGGGGGPSPVTSASLTLPRRVNASTRTGRARVRVACALPAGDACRVSLVARRGRKRTRVGTRRLGPRPASRRLAHAAMVGTGPAGAAPRGAPERHAARAGAGRGRERDREPRDRRPLDDRALRGLR